jgi:pimeloyl-ACP methyl ester carboxylesterase
MKLCLVPALVAALAPVSSALRTLNGWYPCADYTFSDEGSSGEVAADCAMYNAPLCYPGICDASAAQDKTVDIFVKRVLAVEGCAENATNVWVLQGGPGDSSTAMESLMLDLHTQLGGTVNLDTMDHRGTGRSTFLDCVAAQAATTGSPHGQAMDPLEVPSCARALHVKYGDLASFSVTSAATDLATFIDELTNDADSIVYGVSYGTALVERLLHLSPPTVKGYVLDSVATSSGAPADKFAYVSTWNVDFGEVGDRFLALCAEDEECAARFEPDGLLNTLQHVLDAFDRAPNATCAALMKSVKSGLKDEPPSLVLRGALSVLVGRLALRKLLPPVAYRLNRCSREDVEVLNSFVVALNADLAFSGKTTPCIRPCCTTSSPSPRCGSPPRLQWEKGDRGSPTPPQ